jgi:hypothetical protein
MRPLPYATGVVAATISLLLVASPAQAMIGGQIDGSTHSYVGAVDTTLAGAPVPASGVLVSPTVLVTAAHVTRFFDRVGQTRARVTFDPAVSGASTWYWGTVHSDPLYVGSEPKNETDDLGVIVFDSPIPGVTPAALPTANFLEAIGPRALGWQGFVAVGYGVSAFLGGPNGAGVPYPVPDLSSAGTRKAETLEFVSFTSAWLRMEPLDGHACFGDSGGPALLGGSNVAVAITIAEANLELCSGDALSMRLDTPRHRAFLGQYVALP